MKIIEDEHAGHGSHHSHTKYEQAFRKFDPAPTDAVVTERVNAIINKHYKANYSLETLKALHGCIDLTTLNATDTRESVWQLVDRQVNDYEGVHPDVANIAAICVYPYFVETVKQALTAKDVKIASVAGGFPASQTFTEVKVAETALAIMQGAEEIDTVINLGCFLEEDYEACTDELSEIKDSCRSAALKVILETGALVTAENIRKAAILALYSGADFIKTSTGKGYGGATLEATYTMCCVIKQYAAVTGRKAGIKVAGGIRTAEDAVKYYTIVKETLGKEYLNNKHFRIGASALLGDLERKIAEY